MTYRPTATDKFDKSFKKLDRQTQRITKSWIKKNLMNYESPHLFSKALRTNRGGQWRYRVGDYRILAEICNQEIVLILVDVGHRSRIY